MLIPGSVVGGALADLLGPRTLLLLLTPLLTAAMAAMHLVSYKAVQDAGLAEALLLASRVLQVLSVRRGPLRRVLVLLVLVAVLSLLVSVLALVLLHSLVVVLSPLLVLLVLVLSPLLLLHSLVVAIFSLSPVPFVFHPLIVVVLLSSIFLVLHPLVLLNLLILFPLLPVLHFTVVVPT